MERRLDTTTGKFKVYNRALLELNRPFCWSVLPLARITLPLPTFSTFAGCHPPLLAPSFFDYRFLLCCPLTPLPTVVLLHWPHPPLTTGPSFVNLTVANLTCRLQPHLSTPSSLSLALTNEPLQLEISLDKTPKFPFHNLVDLSSS